MKPKKNHVFCPLCYKHKMQYATEEEANRFLMYNSEEIRKECDRAPIRSYFCRACNCWHVTSKPKVLEQPTEPMLPREDRYMEKTAKAAVRENVKEIKEVLHMINRFVTGHGGENAESVSYYKSLFEQVISDFNMIMNCLSQKQVDYINHRICIVRPLIAEM